MMSNIENNEQGSLQISLHKNQLITNSQSGKSDSNIHRELLYGPFKCRSPKAMGAPHVCACARIKKYLDPCCANRAESVNSRLHSSLIVLYVTLFKLAARSGSVTSHGSPHVCSLFCPSVVDPNMWIRQTHRSLSYLDINIPSVSTGIRKLLKSNSGLTWLCSVVVYIKVNARQHIVKAGEIVRVKQNMISMGSRMWHIRGNESAEYTQKNYIQINMCGVL